MKPALLVRMTRGNLTEREHLGFIVLVDRLEKIISKIGEDQDTPIFMRSCAKPFQALPVITSGAYDNFNFSLKELAICSASHAASNEHLEVIRGILKKIGLNETYLQCGTHEPFDIEERNRLIRNSLNPSCIHNNCSGKHTGMLTVCVNNKWDIKNYLDFNHPLQQKIIDNIKKYCNIRENIEISVDNCTAPVHGIPLYKMGAGYLRLFLSEEGKNLRNAFAQNPVLIGGKGRLDSLIMEVTGGRLILKTGAEGLCIIANPEKEESLVVKIMDANMQARSLVVLESLRQLGWLKKDELNSEQVKQHISSEIKTHKNKVVGKAEFLFKI